MTASTLTIVIAVASLLFLIRGTVVAVLTIFTRRSDRNMERSEARQTEALNQFKAQILATLKRIEDGQADQNEQISELARAMYVLNGQVQGIVVYLRTEGIEMNEDILSATQPAISSISAQG